MVAFIILLIIIVVLLYNQLIREKHQIDNTFSTVDVILKKRYDLIPNLVETVKGYANYEKSVYENITSLRNMAMHSYDKNEIVKLDRGISDGINELLLLAEDYPALKASENFLKLQKTLEKIENELSAARRTYNAAVTEYNISIESFPTNIIANICQMKKSELFTIEETIRNNIKIDV